MKQNKKEMGKRGTISGIGQTFLALITISLVAVIFYVLIAQILTLNVVTTGNSVNDTNASDAVAAVRDAGNIGVSFLPIIVLATIGFAILGIFIGRKLNKGS